MRIFLDANILFSASFPQSRTRLLLVALHKHATFLTNLYAAEEARRNLELKEPKAVRALEQLLSECEIVNAILTDLSVIIAAKDVPILGGAIAGNATHLLTGDERDFGVLWGKTIQGVTIVSPRMIAAILVKKKRKK